MIRFGVDEPPIRAAVRTDADRRAVDQCRRQSLARAGWVEQKTTGGFGAAFWLIVGAATERFGLIVGAIEAAVADVNP